ncbi:hypothetical protein [Nonomuraea sp. NPDC048916]|uniref:hypothetical protein n=1 Tax=Nonomuraea sp. NPDC048916 TaxID=3154232 RepID=UPI0033D82AD3
MESRNLQMSASGEVFPVGEVDHDRLFPRLADFVRGCESYRNIARKRLNSDGYFESRMA